MGTDRVDFVSTEEAARLLGVSVQHVRRLLETGDLARLARGVVDRNSIDRYLAARPASRTRVWSESTAWAAIALLSDHVAAVPAGPRRVDWLGPTQASRLRATLRSVTDPAEFVVRARDRAVVRSFSGHRSAVARLAHDLAITNPVRLGLSPRSGDVVDGYINARTLASTVQSLGLVEDPGGSITLRATNFDLRIVVELAEESVLAALDAATSLDPRERGLGERALSAALESYGR